MHLMWANAKLIINLFFFFVCVCYKMSVSAFGMCVCVSFYEWSCHRADCPISHGHRVRGEGVWVWGLDVFADIKPCQLKTGPVTVCVCVCVPDRKTLRSSHVCQGARGPDWKQSKRSKSTVRSKRRQVSVKWLRFGRKHVPENTHSWTNRHRHMHTTRTLTHFKDQ